MSECPRLLMIGLLLAVAVLVPGTVAAQVPADATGTRPATLAPPPTPPAEPLRPIRPLAPTETRDPAKETGKPVPLAGTETSKVPQVTRFPELTEGEGNSAALLKD